MAQGLQDVEQLLAARGDVRVAWQVGQLIEADPQQVGQPQAFFLLAGAEHAGIADQGFQFGADVTHAASTAAPGQRFSA